MTERLKWGDLGPQTTNGIIWSKDQAGQKSWPQYDNEADTVLRNTDLLDEITQYRQWHRKKTFDDTRCCW